MHLQDPTFAKMTEGRRPLWRQGLSCINTSVPYDRPVGSPTAFLPRRGGTFHAWTKRDGGVRTGRQVPSLCEHDLPLEWILPRWATALYAPDVIGFGSDNPSRPKSRLASHLTCTVRHERHQAIPTMRRSSDHVGYQRGAASALSSREDHSMPLAVRADARSCYKRPRRPGCRHACGPEAKARILCQPWRFSPSCSLILFPTFR